MTMETLAERLYAAFEDNNGFDAECKKVAAEIKDGKTNLSILVEKLGDFLTHKEVDQRKRGVQVLSTVLSLLPKNFLSSTELNFLINFYTDRLKDNYNVVSPTLRGLLSILQMEKVPTETFAELFFEMFQHVQCQSLPKSERRIMYHIFQAVLQSHLEAVKELKIDFVYGLISSIDGERDPQNLMLLFKILPRFMTDLSLGPLVEEMFEILACYFPVDYNPVGPEEKNISREDLAEALAPCLYAIPEFAPHCLPIITDKMTSELKIAKNDSLKLLIASSSTFGVAGLKPHLTEIWSCLKDETTSNDPEIRALGLEAVTTIVQVLSGDADESSKFVEKIISDIKRTLTDVQLNFYWFNEKILEAVAKANSNSCKQVLRTFVPVCLALHLSKTSPEEKVIILRSLGNFLSICLDLKFSVSEVPELSWADLTSLLLSELESTDVAVKIEAIQGLTAQRIFLNDYQRTNIYKKFLNAAESDSDALRNASVAGITAFADLYPTEVLDTVMNEFKIETETVDSSTLTILVKRLEALSTIAKIPEIGQRVLPNIVDLAASSSVDLSIAALSCLNKVVATKPTNSSAQKFLHDCNASEKLTQINIEDSPEKLHLVSGICRSVVRTLDLEEQKQLLKRHEQIFEREISDDKVLFFEAILIPLSREVTERIKIASFFDELARLALYSTNELMRIASCKVISIFVHKLVATDYVENYVKPLKKKVEGILRSEECLEIKKAAVILHTWMVKSVVICGIPGLSQEFLNDQIKLLRLKDVGILVAEEFKTLVAKNEDTFLKENGCRVMFLYKQRIFENLIRESENFIDEERYTFLVALAIVLEEVPMELLMLHLIQVVPMLAESLTLSESRLLSPMLTSLQLLLVEKHEIFSDKAGHIIPRLLELTTFPQMKVRMAALGCLTNYTKYSTHPVYSFKLDVLDKLQVAVDDRKRLVRKLAANARSRWFLFEPPSSMKIL